MFQRIVACMIIILPSLSIAQNYTRGHVQCGDFATMEKHYRADNNDIDARMAYGLCLIAKGDDTTGLSHLEAAAAKDEVKAIFALAEYAQTGGTFDTSQIRHDTIDEAIALYYDAVDEMQDIYPYDGNEIYERNRQMELRAHYRIPMLYYQKFKLGVTGAANMYIRSGTRDNFGGDGNTYPDHAPFTEDSLKKMRRAGQECLNHFSAKGYHRYHDYALYTQIVTGNEEITPGCQIYVDAADTLLPQEKEWRTVLADMSCTDDLYNCAKHDAILDELDSALARINDAFKEMWRAEIAEPDN